MTFIQNEAAPGENEDLDTLNELAGGHPHILLIAHEFGDDGKFAIKMDVGGGVNDLNTIWHFLDKAKRAVEIEMMNRGEVPAYEHFDE